MTKQKTARGNIVHYASLGAALAFCLFSLVFFSVQKENTKAFMSLVSILYVFIPDIAQKLFKFRIQDTLYVFILIYTICPLLGYSYNLYYYLEWWDDILHAFAGVIFAMLGAYLPKVLCKEGEPSLGLCLFSAFFFSVAIAGLWELAEFTMDTFFGTDMQKDTLLVSMRPSYVMSEMVGGDTGELVEINQIGMLINGVSQEGYVDLGIIDSMKDVFVETMGAVVYVIIYRAGDGKFFVFERVAQSCEQTAESEAEPAPLPVGVLAEIAPTEDCENEPVAKENADE